MRENSTLTHKHTPYPTPRKKKKRKKTIKNDSGPWVANSEKGDKIITDPEPTSRLNINLKTWQAETLRNCFAPSYYRENHKKGTKKIEEGKKPRGCYDSHELNDISTRIMEMDRIVNCSKSKEGSKIENFIKVNNNLQDLINVLMTDSRIFLIGDLKRSKYFQTFCYSLVNFFKIYLHSPSLYG